MPKFDAAIFDLDGTLFDSMGIWNKIDIDFLSRRSLVPDSDYMEKIGAMTETEIALYTIKTYSLSDTPEELIKEWNDMAIYEYTHNIPLKPHAFEYIKKLKSQGIKLASATSSNRALYEPAMKRNGIFDFFDLVTSANHISISKTSPLFYKRISDMLGVKAERCIVFEDVLTAARSAKNAGMAVCGVFDEAARQNEKSLRSLSDFFIYSFADAPDIFNPNRSKI